MAAGGAMVVMLNKPHVPLMAGGGAMVVLLSKPHVPLMAGGGGGGLWWFC